MPIGYRDLGPTQLLTAIADPGGPNQSAGNWTVVADSQALNCKVALAEVYQIAIDGPIGSKFSLYRNMRLWNNVIQGWHNNYDPQNPLYIRPGDSLFFYWNVGTGQVPQPTAIIWMHYDTTLAENKFPGGG